ncbi:hypothetical protein PWT90_06691 [Aphanocladium album]|nr:hypothetical protein PWT90_06691 [Aphanocladium album]
MADEDLLLPSIFGFAEENFKPPRLAKKRHSSISNLLATCSYLEGSRAARIYTNLVVLFRLLSYYDSLKSCPEFWDWVAVDWKMKTTPSCQKTSDIVSLYAKARRDGHRSNESRRPLLACLVDEWLRCQHTTSTTSPCQLSNEQINTLRNSWFAIRDNHANMFLDNNLPLCLLGVKPSGPPVTSVTDGDLELENIFKSHSGENSQALTEKPNPFTVLAAGSPNQQASTLKREAPDERIQRVPVSKRAKQAGQLNHTTTSDRDSTTLSWQTHQQIPNLSEANQFASQFASIRVSRSPPVSTRHADLRSQLQGVSDQIGRRREEVNSRMQTEAAGSFSPATSAQPTAPVGTLNRETYVIGHDDHQVCRMEMRKLEQKIAALENAQREGSNWARSMGRFLSDANEKSLRSFQDVFAAVETLQRAATALLESDERRN